MIDTLVQADHGELRAHLLAGHPIDPAALDDTEYHGISLGLPGWVDRLTWKKFFKVFHRDGATGLLRGWNAKAEQTPLDTPWVLARSGGEPQTYGHYEVVGAPERCPVRLPQALTIHYGLGGNARFDATRLLRDPLVALSPGQADLLLGWSYLELAGRGIGTPSYFLLVRGGPLSHIVTPPRVTAG